jgi:hypothetical protein
VFLNTTLDFPVILDGQFSSVDNKSKKELDGACNTHGRGKKCIENFSR